MTSFKENTPMPTLCFTLREMENYEGCLVKKCPMESYVDVIVSGAYEYVEILAHGPSKKI